MKSSPETFVPLPPASSYSKNPPAPLFGSSNLQNKSSSISAIDDMFDIFFEDGVFDDANVFNSDMSLVSFGTSPPQDPPQYSTSSNRATGGASAKGSLPDRSAEEDDEYFDDLDDLERGKHSRSDGDLDKNERR
jgi:hypothetical protein